MEKSDIVGLMNKLKETENVLLKVPLNVPLTKGKKRMEKKI